MHTTIDPTTMLGRYSEVVTSNGVINGTILAVGAKGVSVAINREVVRISPSEIHRISPGH